MVAKVIDYLLVEDLVHEAIKVISNSDYIVRQHLARAT